MCRFARIMPTIWIFLLFIKEPALTKGGAIPSHGGEPRTQARRGRQGSTLLRTPSCLTQTGAVYGVGQSPAAMNLDESITGETCSDQKNYCGNSCGGGSATMDRAMRVTRPESGVLG